ncbi:hypothetical protein [Calothrix sp. UHCC 0171]|uniref:hypothetical protein n=1 Tax=Calothrix sp. UHCC 0171 TaxID=3110245 RepID=UPI002B20DB2C|nr:hypothetical protein [Calothrix sp. UHCC 0171]MEA5574072.1 hypothetical protein [Calothrix sp. UHCC 0171]
MSTFNPNSRQLTSQEWQIIATDAISDNNCQYLIIAGIIGGLMTASATAFPPTGFVIAAWGFYAAIKRTQASNRNEIAINNYACVAHVLSGDNLRDFRSQVGDTEARIQIQWALENGYSISNDALDFLETQPNLPSGYATLTGQKLTPPSDSQISSPKQLPISTPILERTSTQLITFDKQVPNLPFEFARSLKNSLIVGVPGAGKGIFVTNALKHIKQDNKRQITIFYIDPKNDPNETKYFSGRVDYLFRQDLMICDAADAYKWLQNCIQKFDEFDAGLGYKLLVFDELNLVTKTLKRIEGGLGWLEGKLTGYSSSGSSRGIVLWGISQNAHTKGLGFDGGTRSIFIPVFLISADNLSASEGILRATMIPSDKKLSTAQIKSLCDKSPVGRAIFYGGLNEWFPMPKLPNYSGFDRDSRQFIDEPTTIEENDESADFKRTSPKLSKVSQTEKMIKMLAATSECSISDFIKKELKINNINQEKELIAGIIEILNERREWQLIKKFSLDI